ncbi:hypothetical protein CAPTEDRAFT_222053 [Capitella teleta]|uniref:Poly [ADP-ribose] polymerase n=1 Tax=Capitella teleta TaxID=283909 RepID=R7TCN0_CAPTE|nr:hypothetical protein CAPTEDRAFT_222053 [Capitella teleta]|eukprot:ELT91498.1 hypothetical protein CAPTEDRAFT_222053 [Capitella teleta]
MATLVICIEYQEVGICLSTGCMHMHVCEDWVAETCDTTSECIRDHSFTTPHNRKVIRLHDLDPLIEVEGDLKKKLATGDTQPMNQTQSKPTKPTKPTKQSKANIKKKKASRAACNKMIAAAKAKSKTEGSLNNGASTSKSPVKPNNGQNLNNEASTSKVPVKLDNIQNLNEISTSKVPVKLNTNGQNLNNKTSTSKVPVKPNKNGQNLNNLTSAFKAPVKPYTDVNLKNVISASKPNIKGKLDNVNSTSEVPVKTNNEANLKKKPSKTRNAVVNDGRNTRIHRTFRKKNNKMKGFIVTAKEKGKEVLNNLPKENSFMQQSHPSEVSGLEEPEETPLAEVTWEWKDNNGDWQPYGLEEKGVQQDLIESGYQLKDSAGVIVFERNGHLYNLNFHKMMQRNMMTQKEREVRRNPVQDGRAELRRKSYVQKQLPVMSPLWSPMDTRNPQQAALVAISSEQAEFKDVAAHFTNSSDNPKGTFVTEIFRIQNKDLWSRYYNMKVELHEELGDDYNEMILYHGVKNLFDVLSICNQNFDCQLSSDLGNNRPDGAYFSARSELSHMHTAPDAQGHRYMFMATVLVGKYAQYLRGLTMPDPLTLEEEGITYGCVVDSMAQPSTYITYNDDQAYPMYLIQYCDSNQFAIVIDPTEELPDNVEIAQLTSNDDGIPRVISTNFDSGSLESRKHVFGVRLYHRIQPSHPEFARKITGMLLELDDSQLAYLLSDPDTLKDKVDEAVEILKEHEYKVPLKTCGRFDADRSIAVDKNRTSGLSSPFDQMQMSTFFNLVQSLNPEFAGEIVELLLLFEESELLHLLECRRSLRARVEEALEALLQPDYDEIMDFDVAKDCNETRYVFVAEDPAEKPHAVLTGFDS